MGHQDNPEGNVHTAIGILSKMMPVGKTQADEDARYAIEMLSMAVQQQANMYGMAPNEPHTEATWSSAERPVEKIVSQLAEIQITTEERSPAAAPKPTPTATQSDHALLKPEAIPSAPTSTHSLLKGPACFGDRIKCKIGRAHV